MDSTLRLVLLFGVLIYFIAIVWLLKKKKLALRYTLMWLLGGLMMLIVLLFEEQFEYLVSLVGVQTPMNGIFAVVFFILILILMMLTSIASEMNSKNRKVVENMALYEKRIRELEKQVQEMSKKNENNN